ncbi:hypothetical protein LTR15_005578 [Elasticomyces elasticus]|nr:hypothetical protein LTR15_005578 [Elasticomyces elasticus]
MAAGSGRQTERDAASREDGPIKRKSYEGRVRIVRRTSNGGVVKDEEEGLRVFNVWYNFLTEHWEEISNAPLDRIGDYQKSNLRAGVKRFIQKPAKGARGGRGGKSGRGGKEKGSGDDEGANEDDGGDNEAGGRKRPADEQDDGYEGDGEMGEDVGVRNVKRLKIDNRYQWGALLNLMVLLVPSAVLDYIRRYGYDARYFFGYDTEIGKALASDTLESATAYLYNCAITAKQLQARQSLDAARLVFVQSAMYRMCLVIDTTCQPKDFTGQKLKKSLILALRPLVQYMASRDDADTAEVTLQQTHDLIRAGYRIELLRTRLCPGALLILAPILTPDFLRRRAPVRSVHFTGMLEHLNRLDILEVAQPYNQLADDIRASVFDNFYAARKKETDAGLVSNDSEDVEDIEEDEDGDDDAYDQADQTDQTDQTDLDNQLHDHADTDDVEPEEEIDASPRRRAGGSSLRRVAASRGR